MVKTRATNKKTSTTILPKKANKVKAISKKSKVKSPYFQIFENLATDLDLDPTHFIGASEKVQKELLSKTTSAVELLFNYSRTKDPKRIRKRNQLKKLITKGFDSEQVYQQIALSTEPVLGYLEKQIRKLSKASDKELRIVPESDAEESEEEMEEEDNDEKEEEEEEESEDNDKEEEDEEEEDDEDDALDLAELQRLYSKEAPRINEDDSDNDNDDNNNNNNEEEEEEKTQSKSKKARKNKNKKKLKSGEDRFFRFDDMENFIAQAEAAEEADKDGNNKNDKDYDDDDDDDDEAGQLGLSNSISLSDLGDVETLNEIARLEEEKAELNDNDNDFENDNDEATYKDFFDPPDEELSFDDENDENDGLGEDGYEDDDDWYNRDDSGEQNKEMESVDKELGKFQRIRQQELSSDSEGDTPYQRQQKALARKISELEASNLAERPWELKGEVTAKKRPKESLLETFLEFDQAAKATPAITEETTKSIEEIIRARIKDDLWDDPVPKSGLEASSKPRTRTELDSERSKEGLGTIYEKEFMGQMNGIHPDKNELDEATQKAHAEIDAMWKKVVYKLNALSNFAFTPKPIIEDLAVKSNLPSLSMEEAVPMTVSNASLVTPEEAYQRVQESFQGETELTQEERKARRRDTKRLRRAVRRRKEAEERLVEKINPGLGNKYAKEKALEKLRKDSTSNSRGSKSIQITDKSRNSMGQRTSDSGTTSSNTLFAALQNEAQSQISGFRSSIDNSKQAKLRLQKEKSTRNVGHLKFFGQRLPYFNENSEFYYPIPTTGYATAVETCIWEEESVAITISNNFGGEYIGKYSGIQESVWGLSGTGGEISVIGLEEDLTSTNPNEVIVHQTMLLLTYPDPNSSPLNGDGVKLFGCSINPNGNEVLIHGFAGDTVIGDNSTNWNSADPINGFRRSLAPGDDARDNFWILYSFDKSSKQLTFKDGDWIAFRSWQYGGAPIVFYDSTFYILNLSFGNLIPESNGPDEITNYPQGAASYVFSLKVGDPSTTATVGGFFLEKNDLINARWEASESSFSIFEDHLYTLSSFHYDEPAGIGGLKLQKYTREGALVDEVIIAEDDSAILRDSAGPPIFLSRSRALVAFHIFNQVSGTFEYNFAEFSPQDLQFTIYSILTHDSTVTTYPNNEFFGEPNLAYDDCTSTIIATVTKRGSEPIELVLDDWQESDPSHFLILFLDANSLEIKDFIGTTSNFFDYSKTLSVSENWFTLGGALSDATSDKLLGQPSARYGNGDGPIHFWSKRTCIFTINDFLFIVYIVVGLVIVVGLAYAGLLYARKLQSQNSSGYKFPPPLPEKSATTTTTTKMDQAPKTKKNGSKRRRKSSVHSTNRKGSVHSTNRKGSVHSTNRKSSSSRPISSSTDVSGITDASDLLSRIGLATYSNTTK